MNLVLNGAIAAYIAANNLTALTDEVGIPGGTACLTDKGSLVYVDSLTFTPYPPSAPATPVALRTQTMYDSTTAADIPADAKVVAGYVDGLYKWSQADWDRFVNATLVTIAISPATRADVLDCETGDATPEDCPAWIRMQQANGLKLPVIYCSASIRSLVESACDGLTYGLWIADWDNDPTIPEGCVGKQYSDPPASGGHWDLSLVREDWIPIR